LLLQGTITILYTIYNIIIKAIPKPIAANTANSNSDAGLTFLFSILFILFIG